MTTEDLYFSDCFTETANGIDLEVNNLTVGCITSSANAFNLDSEGNLTVKTITATDQTIPSSGITLSDVYPVGSIYMSVNSTDPSTLFGGVWEYWGAGKTPIAVNTSDTDFNTVEKVGGSKVHTHTSASHIHNINNCVALVNTYGATVEILGKSYGWNSGERVNCSSYTGSGRYQDWAVQTRGDTSPTTPSDTGSASTLQPYITCYMWKRVS